MEENKKNFKIGFKEVKNLLSENRAGKVILAEDCEDKIKSQVLASAKEKGVEVEFAESMKSLGKLCGIDVGASCVASIKE